MISDACSTSCNHLDLCEVRTFDLSFSLMSIRANEVRRLHQVTNTNLIRKGSLQ